MRLGMFTALALGAGLAIGLSARRRKQLALQSSEAPNLDASLAPDLEKPAPSPAPRMARRTTPRPDIATADLSTSPAN